MQIVSVPSKVTLRPFEESDSETWDRFIDSSINGTIFHRKRFLGYHPSGRFTDNSLLIYTKNSLSGVFPAAIINDHGRKVLKSHPGSSFGGIVVASAPGINDASLMVSELVRYAEANGFSRIEFRLPPKIYGIYPVEELEFAYRLNGFLLRDMELATCYPLGKITGEPTEENILRTFDDPCRRSTAKALKSGLECRICDDAGSFEAFWDILAENLKKHGVKPTHAKHELVDLKKRFPDDVKLIGVLDGGKMIAGVVTFVVNSAAAHVFYFGSLYEYQERRGVNLAVLRLIQFAASRGLKFVNFGISTEDRGRHVNWGLFRFKEGFGGHGVIRSYWVRELP